MAAAAGAGAAAAAAAGAAAAAAVSAAAVGVGALFAAERVALFFKLFAYVCPEPGLANDRSLGFHQKRVRRDASSTLVSYSTVQNTRASSSNKTHQ